MNLDFKVPALNSFEFLEKDYNYKIKKDSYNEIIYENDLVIITLNYDYYRFEINMYFELKNNSSIEVLRAGSLSSFYCCDLSWGMASEQKRLESCLERLACFIKTKVVAALMGNELFFKRLNIYDHEENVKYTKALHMSFIRNRLDKLWAEKTSRKL